MLFCGSKGLGLTTLLSLPREPVVPHMAQNPAGTFASVRLQPHKPRDGRMLRCFCCFLCQLFTYFCKPSTTFMCIDINKGVWVHLQRRLDVNIARDGRAGSRPLVSGSHPEVNLQLHLQLQPEVPALNVLLNTAITLPWQYHPWAIPTAHHIALEGYPKHLGCVLTLLSAPHSNRALHLATAIQVSM
uniref:Uncharacterized protein n=1 Tax=Cyanoderma ruficeps TaxID=181631 RepID=A0A8C3X6V2_9PASS